MTHSEISSWCSRTIRRPGRPLVDWLQLGTLGSPEFTVGIVRDGAWVVDTADGLADLQDSRALTFAFPLLNSSVNDVRRQLTEFRQTAGSTARSEFPLNRLVIHAISSGGYWAEQAFRWLPEIEFDDSESADVLEGLSSIEGDKAFSQKLRHEALRHRRTIEMNRGMNE